ncbi:hypothetical protein HN51_067140 [Arachis hypogaea]
MKAFTYVLIILFIFSIGIGNERLLKVSEAKLCSAVSERGCISGTKECTSDCKQIYGAQATGFCGARKNCICHFPC